MTEHPDRLLSSVVSAMQDCVAEVERLRAALAQIADFKPMPRQRIDHLLQRMQDEARAALAPKEPSE